MAAHEGTTIEEAAPCLKPNDQPSQAMTELLLEFLRKIKQTPSQTLMALGSSDQQVIFKVIIEGVCYTLLCSDGLVGKVSLPGTLTPREQEIVRLIARGLPNKTIATILDISPWTVNTHIRRVFGKLNVSSRSEMVAVVMNQRLNGR